MCFWGLCVLTFCRNTAQYVLCSSRSRCLFLGRQSYSRAKVLWWWLMESRRPTRVWTKKTFPYCPNAFSSFILHLFLLLDTWEHNLWLLFVAWILFHEVLLLVFRVWADAGGIGHVTCWFTLSALFSRSGRLDVVQMVIFGVFGRNTNHV